MRILSIKNINLEIKNLQGKCVRTWGKINLIDQERSIATISYGNCILMLRTFLMPRFDGQKGDIAQFIGDVGDNVLIVKSCKKINELDIDFFEFALERRNAFLENQVSSSAVEL